MKGALVDTGFLVALFRAREKYNIAATRYLAAHRMPLLTVAPVLVETAFFLGAAGKRNLLEWVGRGAMRVVEWSPSAFPATAAIIARYADRDIDLADAALIWLAGETGFTSILTLDEQDFSVYRLARGKRFELTDWGAK
ncbi:MAG: type II toxin-antitoxin system VapC family toxin [Burkholderiales bacterium]